MLRAVKSGNISQLGSAIYRKIRRAYNYFCQKNSKKETTSFIQMWNIVQDYSDHGTCPHA
jgi:hypothetical protein